MLKTKQELCNHLYQKCKEIVFDNVAINNVAEEMNQKYNVPTGLATGLTNTHSRYIIIAVEQMFAFLKER